MYKKGLSFLCGLLSVVLAITIGLLLSKFGVPLGAAGWVFIGVFIRLVLFFAIEDGVRRVKAFFRSLTRRRERAVSSPYVYTRPAPPEKVYLEKPWEFEFVLTDENTRKRIADHVRKNYTSRDQPYLMRLNLAYGIANILLAVACFFCVHNPALLSYVYAAGLAYSACLRIAQAFRKTAIVYVP